MGMNARDRGVVIAGGGPTGMMLAAELALGTLDVEYGAGVKRMRLEDGDGRLRCHLCDVS